LARSSDISQGRLIAVDWGTSRLRAMLVDTEGRILAEAASDEGIGAMAGGHESAFERLVAEWPKVPAIMAGMVGSRQGWREAAYVPCPASPRAIAEKLLRFETSGGRPVAIVPGLMIRSPKRDGDVIRGEETQIVGLIDRDPDFAGVAILPGTHSKWVAIAAGTVTDFQTYLSGEMFDLLAHHSFLRHSVAEAGGDLSEAPDFTLAVRRVAEEGLPFLGAIFSVRARQILGGVNPTDNRAYLSGLVIGGELAAAWEIGLLSSSHSLQVIGTPSLARAYGRALTILGYEAAMNDGQDLALRGLIHLAGASGFARFGDQP
jgi:2-dehydro-3-deoxygalactonokinase